MNGRECFKWGCVGAVAPEVLRFFKIVSEGKSLPSLNWIEYFLLLLLYVVMAGAISVAFKPDSPWKGLWVGASLPALVATLVQTSPVK
jgi:hypothetical protein